MMIQFRPILGAARAHRGTPLRGVVTRFLLGSALVGTLLAMGGCGQKGPLYLPMTTSASQHSTQNAPQP